MSIRSLLIISSLSALVIFFLVAKDAMKSLSTPENVGASTGEQVSTVSLSDESKSKSWFSFDFSSKSETEDPFDEPESIRADTSGLTLMKFGASWCGPCRMLDKELEKLEDKYPDLNVTYVDVDSQSRKAESFGVSSIPHSFLLKNGKRVGDRVGYQSEEKLERWIKQFAEAKPIKMHSNPFVK